MERGRKIEGRHGWGEGHPQQYRSTLTPQSPGIMENSQNSSVFLDMFLGKANYHYQNVLHQQQGIKLSQVLLEPHYILRMFLHLEITLDDDLVTFF